MEEELKNYAREHCSEAIEQAGRAAFLSEYPKEDWDRLDVYYQARYRKMAKDAIRAWLKATEDE